MGSDGLKTRPTWRLQPTPQLVFEIIITKGCIVTFLNHTLRNGLTIIGEPSPQARSVALGFFVRTGSRDETTEVSGVTHFLEHMAFNGTRRFPKAEIVNYLEKIGMRFGADLTATAIIPTMRCIMTTLAQGDLPRDLEVLRTLTRENRIEIPGLGTWSCVGAYAVVAAPGRVQLGDEVTIAIAA